MAGSRDIFVDVGTRKDPEDPMGIDLEGWKYHYRSDVDETIEQLPTMSRTIPSDPELFFKDHRASARLASELEQCGLAVTRGVGGLETAFRAELAGGGPGPTLAILAEYDAL